MLRLQVEVILYWWVQWRRWGVAVTPQHLTGATRSHKTRAVLYIRTLFWAVKGLIWAGSRPRLNGVGKGHSLCWSYGATSKSWAVDDDVCFLLSWTVSAGWTGFWAFLWPRTVAVTGTLLGAVTRAGTPSVVLIDPKGGLDEGLSSLGGIVASND